MFIKLGHGELVYTFGDADDADVTTQQIRDCLVTTEQLGFQYHTREYPVHCCSEVRQVLLDCDRIELDQLTTYIAMHFAVCNATSSNLGELISSVKSQDRWGQRPSQKTTEHTKAQVSHHAVLFNHASNRRDAGISYAWPIGNVHYLGTPQGQTFTPLWKNS